MNIPKRTAAIVIAALCLVYLVTRLWGLTDSCLWFDEIFGVHAAEHSWSGLWWFVALDLIHPPLFYALLKAWIAIGGEGLFWLRMFSVIASALALLPFLLLCKELKLGRETNIVALFLFAVNGAMIKYAQEVRMYSLLLLLSTFTLWLFARFFYRGKGIWMLTFVNILLVYTHYFGWFVVACEVGAIIIAQRVKSRHVIVMLGIVVGAFVPWIITVAKAASAGSALGQNIGWIERPTLFSFFQFALDLVEPFYFQETSYTVPSIYAVAVPILLIIAAAKVINILRAGELKEKSAFLLLATFILVPIVLAIALSWLLPYSIWGTRHLTITFVPVFILSAFYLMRVPWKLVRWSLLAGVMMLTIAGFVVRFLTPKPPFVWCGFEPIGEKLQADLRGPIYVFEDLAAYHLWFTFRTFPDAKLHQRVVKVDDFPGMTEDKAFFIPRGVDDEFLRRGPLPMTAGQFWIVYRAPSFDLTKPPMDTLTLNGFHVDRVETYDGDISNIYAVYVEKK